MQQPQSAIASSPRCRNQVQYHTQGNVLLGAPQLAGPKYRPHIQGSWYVRILVTNAAQENRDGVQGKSAETVCLECPGNTRKNGKCYSTLKCPSRWSVVMSGQIRLLSPPPRCEQGQHHAYVVSTSTVPVRSTASAAALEERPPALPPWRLVALLLGASGRSGPPRGR